MLSECCNTILLLFVGHLRTRDLLSVMEHIVVLGASFDPEHLYSSYYTVSTHVDHMMSVR